MTKTGKSQLPLVFLALLDLAGLVFLFFFLFLPLVQESQDLFSLKNELAQISSQKEDFRRLEQEYQASLAELQKLQNLFVDPTAPIDFIAFLEEASRDSGFAIKIKPTSLAKPKTDSWGSITFQISGNGRGQDFLRFLEKMENSPYLLEILSLNLQQFKAPAAGESTARAVEASLIVKVFSR